MNSYALIKLISNSGWYLDRTKGSHHQFKHPIHKGTITIPHPKKDLPIGTVKAILKHAKLD